MSKLFLVCDWISSGDCSHEVFLCDGADLAFHLTKDIALSETWLVSVCVLQAASTNVPQRKVFERCEIYPLVCWVKKNSRQEFHSDQFVKRTLRKSCDSVLLRSDIMTVLFRVIVKCGAYSLRVCVSSDHSCMIFPHPCFCNSLNRRLC